MLAGIVPKRDLDAFNKVLCDGPNVEKVRIYPRIGSVAVTYTPGAKNKKALLSYLSSINANTIDQARNDYTFALAPRANDLFMDIAVLVGAYFAKRWFLPTPIATLWSLWRYRKFLFQGIKSLLKPKLDVPVLDASAIAMSFITGDPKTASQSMFLLELGETMQEYTRIRSENELLYSLLHIPETAQMIFGIEEKTVPSADLKDGDLIVVRTGMPISVDGTIESGIAQVNQSSLTGESLSIERTTGDDVFAGTAVEDGEIFIRVRSTVSETKVRSIVNMVEQSESQKAPTQERMERLADKIVPWNFLLAGAVALITRDITKVSAALMVDYSCALKLTGSIAVLTAMNQSARDGLTVKGSKHFETMAAADTIIFDKTGTLTESMPQLAKIMPIDTTWRKNEILRFAACLEEHFPHPVARAVVRAALEKNLRHRERHAEVEYLVAHGIASSFEGKRAIIGSEHFVIEDEGVVINKQDKANIDAEMEGLSPLYLAINGVLVGVLGISDPLKKDIATDIKTLRDLGFKRVVMLTGDNERTAKKIASEAGITEFHANLLPEQKYNYVEKLRSEGCKIVMVGDGVNDSPALSLADVGIAMGQGTAIAKEVADVTLSGGSLSSLVRFRTISTELMKRLNSCYAQIIGTNSALLAAGISGIMTPQTSSLIHNASTIAFSMRSARSYR